MVSGADSGPFPRPLRPSPLLAFICAELLPHMTHAGTSLLRLIAIAVALVLAYPVALATSASAVGPTCTIQGTPATRTSVGPISMT